MGRRRKKRKYKVHGPTGMRYEKGSMMDDLLSVNRQSHRKSNRNDISLTEAVSEIDPKELKLFGLVVAVILGYVFILRPAFGWLKEHTAIAITISVLVSIAAITVAVWYIKKLIREERAKAEFEKKQIKKGLIKFVDRLGTERWGKPAEVKKWTKEDEEAKEKSKRINLVVDEIENFQPARKYGNEFSYQVELTGYLKSKFKGVDIEKQKGSSRPDIIIEDIAIEIKGPTRSKDLVTIFDKCGRYYQHFAELIIVLFETDVYGPRYDEWLKAIKNTFPRVKVIRK